MKKRNAILIIAVIVLLDQLLKIYVKTNFFYGESRPILGQWFRLHFIENNGMAWGWKFNLQWGKLLLTLFRLVAVIWGSFYIARIIREKRPAGLVLCVALIYAGAMGNLIDSIFYGLIFDKGAAMDPAYTLQGYGGLASFSTSGYGSLFHGNVVDMIYCPIFHGTLPNWVPFWGGENFEFFSMVFNIADASISVGVFILLIFSKRFFNKTRSDLGRLQAEQ